MPAAPGSLSDSSSFLGATDSSLVEQQALNALTHLSDEDKGKALKYIESLVNLEKIKNDQASATKN